MRYLSTMTAVAAVALSALQWTPAHSAALMVAKPPQPAVQINSPYPFPPYKQCDPQWGTDVIGATPSTTTMCEGGSFVTAVSAMLAGVGAPWITPAVLNPFLQEHGGYYCDRTACTNVTLTVPELLFRGAPAIGRIPLPPMQNISANTAAGSVLYIVVTNGDDPVHLLVTGTVGTNLTVWNPKVGVWTTIFGGAVQPFAFAFHRDKYPMYKQCDPEWGNDVMGTNNKTICDVGCLMTSITMGLAGTSIDEYGTTALPNATNKFLQTHHGFVPGSSSLYESVIPQIDPARVQWPSDGMHTTNDLSWTTIAAFIDRAVPRVVIANVMHGEHFVLVTGYRNDGTTLVVNDPGFNKATYDYHADVVGWRIFDME